MKIFPCCKINLGLNVVSRRPDGYHNLETVFYPVPLCDELEVISSTSVCTSLNVKGTDYALRGMCECPIEKNLVFKAYNILKKDYPLPPVNINLFKSIPSQAGLGGGSSDAAYMIRLLNNMFDLNMSNDIMRKYATRIGADCAFFIESKPAYATGIGDELTIIEPSIVSLKEKWLILIKPSIAISTKEAYAGVIPHNPLECCSDIIQEPVDTWKGRLINDFEESVFVKYPVLRSMKEFLYSEDALYASMSGSGSAMFGFFDNRPSHLEHQFDDCFVKIIQL